jgi:NADPH:quinone reductase-like Zn-dependent oxidoreductase
LIHSATGGVGLAAIQLCKYLGAEVGYSIDVDVPDFALTFHHHQQIFATVGSDAKKQFLVENCGIIEDHIFSSRSTEFANLLMKATSGRGVDVILNSLTGDMLHESWRCIGENGTFLEIGKRDMLERNSLSMEPFNRNSSYRAIDMSRKSLPVKVIQR